MLFSDGGAPSIILTVAKVILTVPFTNSKPSASSAITSGEKGAATTGSPAKSLAMYQYSPLPIGSGKLWRSDDAGVHWIICGARASA